MPVCRTRLPSCLPLDQFARLRASFCDSFILHHRVCRFATLHLVAFDNAHTAHTVLPRCAHHAHYTPHAYYVAFTAFCALPLCFRYIIFIFYTHLLHGCSRHTSGLFVKLTRVWFTRSSRCPAYTHTFTLHCRTNICLPFTHILRTRTHLRAFATRDCTVVCAHAVRRGLPRLRRAAHCHRFYSCILCADGCCCVCYAHGSILRAAFLRVLRTRIGSFARSTFAFYVYFAHFTHAPVCAGYTRIAHARLLPDFAVALDAPLRIIVCATIFVALFTTSFMTHLPVRDRCYARVHTHTRGFAQHFALLRFVRYAAPYHAPHLDVCNAHVQHVLRTRAARRHICSLLLHRVCVRAVERILG